MAASRGSDKDYQVELITKRSVLKSIFGGDFTHSQYPMLLHAIRIEVDGDITPMDGQIARVGREPSKHVSLGLLSVGDVESLLNLIDFTNTDSDLDIGSIRAENGDSVYIESNVDENLIRSVGGTVLRSSSGGQTVFQMSTKEVIEFNRRRGVYEKQNVDSLAANKSQSGSAEIDREEISDRIDERVDALNDRLDHIPDSYVMPEPDEMTIGSAKQFRLGIVFVDIAGFSDYAYRNDDEDVLFMLNLLIPEIMELVRENDGDFEKNTGDGILAYFGAGESDEWTSHLVLTYIATIKTVLADFVNPALEAEGVEPVSIKVGAAMGDVYVSRIGVNRLNRRTVVGETANIASKLEDRADAHEYFVSQEFQETAEEADCMWAEHLRPGGTLEGFERDGEDVEYYDFRGVLEPTNISNFVS
jgi:class 3 adenylate cyclase